jgi:hypothetical protein
MEAAIEAVDDNENRTCLCRPPARNGAVFSINAAAAHEGLNPDF